MLGRLLGAYLSAPLTSGKELATELDINRVYIMIYIMKT